MSGFRYFGLAVAAALCGAALSMQAARAETITLRFMHYVSPESANPKYFLGPWAEKIARISGGRLKIEIYPFMQLGGKPAEIFDMVRDGAIDGGWITPGYQPGRFPKTEVLELPFVVTKSAEEASKAAWVYSQKHLLVDFAEVHLIAVHMTGAGVIHKKGGPVVTVEDLKGLKLRGPSRAATTLLEELGAVPIGMPVPAFPEALSKGVVDGGAITWELAPSLKLGELTDSHTDVAGDRALYNLFLAWGMNKARYEALPEDLQAILDANSGFMASAWAGRAQDQGDAIGRQAMVDAGNAITVLSEEESARIRLAADKVIAAWVRDTTAKGLDAEALLRDARAAVELTRAVR